MSQVPSLIDYTDLDTRKETFGSKKWPSGKTQSPQVLTEAGFFYSGNAIECVFMDNDYYENKVKLRIYTTIILFAALHFLLVLW